MAISDRARKVLLEVESELRRLIAEAAQEGDYNSVETVTTWATTVNRVVTGGQIPRPASVASPNAASVGTPPPKSKKPKRNSAKPTRSKGRARSYPKFARSGDSLVKIAWSKSQKSEYKHKSPRSVLSHLVDSLDSLLNRHSLVAMDNVLPLKGEDGQETPDYQVYLCLAWLRSIGAVEQKGRQGYTKNGLAGSLKKVVSEEWNNLSEDV